ncbi:high-affinity choline transporter 1-like [Amblyomma americanum]
MAALGGIPWQVYFQRVLGSDSDFDARMLSYLSAVGCIFLALPPVVIGAAAKSANFTAAGYRGPHYLHNKDSVRVLPYSIRYLTTDLVSILGMLGITAAIMSSADSSMLSASLLVTRNIYQAVVRPMASDAEVAVILRMMVLLIGGWATYLALSVESVFEMWSLCSEVVYVLLFPQLLCVLYVEHSNSYGSLMGFVVGCISRWLLGEPTHGIPVSITLPFYDEEQGQRFPVRLTCMTCGVVTILLVSYSASTVFEKGWLPAHYDVFHCCHHKHGKDQPVDGGLHATGPALALAAGPVHAEAPGAGVVPEARRPSYYPRRDPSVVMDKVPDQVSRDTASTNSKASNVSRTRSMDTVRSRTGSAVDASRRKRASSGADISKMSSASVGDASKMTTSRLATAADLGRASNIDMANYRRTSSLALSQGSKSGTTGDMAWDPMTGKTENRPGAKMEVKRVGSQASRTEAAKNRHRRSRSQIKDSSKRLGAAAPQQEDKTHEEP